MLTAGLALLLSCTKPDRNALPRYMREQGRFSEYASAGKPQEEAENGPSLYLTDPLKKHSPEVTLPEFLQMFPTSRL